VSLAPATCQITIRGVFDRRWTEYLSEVLLNMDVRAGQICTTTVRGHLPDLSAYIGLLNYLSNWGVCVIACEYQQSDPFTEESAEPLQTIGQQL